MLTFQFPNSDADKTSVDVCRRRRRRRRRRRGHVLRVRIMLYSGQLKVYMSAIFGKSKRRNSTVKSILRYLPSNIQAAAFKELLSVRAVA